jgi:methylated-DNA-[protein]-cysteine S-methyltransferase
MTENTYYKSPVGWLKISANGKKITELSFVKRVPDHKKIKNPTLVRAKKELDEYFKGSRKKFSAALLPEGTPFQKLVWTALTKIPFGTVVCYGDIAKMIGRPKAARAVGGACNKNPIAIIIPCHRIIGVSGHLTGYAGGLKIKCALLEHEYTCTK